MTICKEMRNYNCLHEKDVSEFKAQLLTLAKSYLDLKNMGGNLREIKQYSTRINVPHRLKTETPSHRYSINMDIQSGNDIKSFIYPLWFRLHRLNFSTDISLLCNLNPS